MPKQSGQIAIIAAVFVVMVGLLSFANFTPGPPADFSASKNIVSSAPVAKCQTIDDSKEVFRAPERVYVKKGKFDTEDRGEVAYKLIRKDVPMDAKTMYKFEDKQDHHRHAYKMGTKNIGGKDFEIYYPGYSGEVLLAQKVNSESRGNQVKKLYFIDWGLVFLLHIKNGAPESVMVSGQEYYITDIYQNVSKGKIIEEAFKCSGFSSSSTGTKSVAFPSQNPSTSKQQLQLEYFTFDQQAAAAEGLVSEIACKPAVYLYPKNKMLVNVKLAPKGFLTYTDPLYDPKLGWNVIAYPDGRLEIRNTDNEIRNYGYLYYESKIFDSGVVKPKEGFVVEYEKLNDLYKGILPKLGLNEVQIADFVEYWSKALPYSKYYFVGVMDKENIDRIEPLQIVPEPDFVNRVRVYFEGLTEPIQVNEPDLKTLNNNLLTINGFKVVEWGGMIKMDKDHPFTCSQ